MKILFTYVEFSKIFPKLEKLGDEIFGPVIGHPISAVIILCIHFFETEFDCANLFSIQSNVAQKVLS